MQNHILREEELVKYTKKTDYTNQQLQAALLSLMEAKPFDKVTINNIADAAHVNRSTFYRYYDDKYQLLDYIEQGLLDQINQIRGQVDPFADQSAAILQAEVDFFNQHFHDLQILLGNNGDHYFENKLAAGFNQRFAQVIDDQAAPQTELVRLVIISTTMTVLKYWLFNSNQLTPKEVIEVITKIINQGAVPYLRKISQPH